MTAHLCVGMKYGDLCSVLPMLCEIHNRTRQKPIVVVAKRYADIVEDCPSVIPDAWDGDWQDLRGGLKYAKAKYRQVVCLSTYGRDFSIEHRLPGFQLDQWHRGGMLDKFGKLPLTIRPNLPTPEKLDYILFADGSESSAWDKAGDVGKMLDEAYPGRVMRMSKVTTPRFSDLLATYNSAAVLVTIDTAHLHLSAASSVPVIAFAADKPEYWHGSSYHPRFAFYCRYGDFDQRKGEFLHALKCAVSGVPRPKYMDIAGLYAGAFNPSITTHGETILMSYRWYPEDGKSALAMAELDASFKVRRNYPLQVPESLKKFCLEDARFFNFGGKLYLSYVVAKHPMPPHRCAVGYGRVEKQDGEWRLLEDIRPKYGKNDMSAMEKNWLFWEHGGRLFFDYGGVICEVKGDLVAASTKYEIPKWDYGMPHGGCLVNFKGRNLRFFHARVDEKTERGLRWIYRVGVAIQDEGFPFKWSKVNPLPIVAGDEEFRVSRYWKPSVTICYGAIARGDKVYLSVGHNDSACRIYELDEQHLNL